MRCTCENHGCLNYGYPNQSIECCYACKKDGMICLRVKKCAFNSCDIQPTFNFVGERPKYCKTHALKDMINVQRRRCVYNGCQSSRTFNLAGKSPLYCIRHKTDEMVNRTKNKCKFESCNKIVREWCKEHAPEDYIEEQCVKCGNYAYYNLKGLRPMYCSEHRTKEMVNRKNKRCIEEDCKRQASFGEAMGTYEYCRYHKKANMINLKTVSPQKRLFQFIEKERDEFKREFKRARKG